VNKDYLVVDFEFTQYWKREKQGNRPRGFFPEIIEIGAVKFDGETLDKTGEIQNFVRPHFYPNHIKEIMEFCMITEKDMKSAITFAEMLEKIRSYYSPGQTYFAAWGDADYNVLDEGCRRHNVENPVLREDYLDMAAWYKWEMGDGNTTGLRKATEEQCINAEMLWHTACDDATNTGMLLKQLLADGWDPEEFLAANLTVNYATKYRD
jgi:sporulation inhibitor KapD